MGVPSANSRAEPDDDALLDSDKEAEAEDRANVGVGIVYKAVREEGKRTLTRPTLNLACSAVTAGL